MIHELLEENVSKSNALALQQKYRTKKIQFEKNRDIITDFDCIDYLTGVDISYPPEKNPTWGICCAVLWNVKKNKMINATFLRGAIKFPYIPGYLGFREAPLMAKTILKLKTKPDLIMTDGHGIIHPRNFGEATHLGIALNIPSIGVAKSEYVGESNWKELTRLKGKKTPIKRDGKVLGYAICLRNNSKPVFVSRGFLVSLKFAVQLVLKVSSDHRQPEPLFLADHLSRSKLKESYHGVN